MTTTGTAAAANPYRYTSGYQDTDTGLYKLGYRYYDTTQGRFTQPDPSGQEANRYLYATGDPLNKQDANGLSGLVDLGAGLGLAATIVIGIAALPAEIPIAFGIVAGAVVVGGLASGAIIASGLFDCFTGNC